MTHSRFHLPQFYTNTRLFYAVLAALLVVFSVYIYYICATVVNVVVRQEIDQNIAKANSRISDLESRYIEAKERVTLAEANARGFTSSREKIYITQISDTLVVRDR